MKEWHAAQVPGVVQTDLLARGLFPIRSTTITNPAAVDRAHRLGIPHHIPRRCRRHSRHDHVDLVFEGLDTFADVFWNDQPVLHGQYVPAVARLGESFTEELVRTLCASCFIRPLNP